MEIKINHGNEMVITLVGRLDTTTSKELLAAFNIDEVKEELVKENMLMNADKLI